MGVSKMKAKGMQTTLASLEEKDKHSSVANKALIGVESGFRIPHILYLELQVKHYFVEILDFSHTKK
jgi:hypothetical protein